MTTRSLGLRRHTPPTVPSTAPVIYADQAESYGLHRGLPRRRIIPAPNDRDAVSEEVIEAVAEHIEPVTESVAVIEGVETAASVIDAPVYVDPHAGFLVWTDDELVPCSGRYTAKDGCRFIDGVPAFLMEDRAPVSNIH